MNKGDLKKLQNMDFDDVNIDDLPDLENIKISRKKSSRERILDFLNEYKNPYFFKYKGRIIKSTFVDENVKANELFLEYIESLYS